MTTIIRGDFDRSHKKPHQVPEATAPEKPIPVYQLKIVLAFSNPLIWRRLLIPGEMSLLQLHHTIQCSMGWSDIHAHRFLVGKVFYAPQENGELWEKTGERDEAVFSLAMLESDMKWCFTYIYDFGDGWEHEIELEEIFPKTSGQDLPVLIAGEGACPPENVGGIPGYEEFLAIINNPKHKEYQRMAQWCGADHFDPQFFDPSEANRGLRRH